MFALKYSALINVGIPGVAFNIRLVSIIIDFRIFINLIENHSGGV